MSDVNECDIESDNDPTSSSAFQAQNLPLSPPEKSVDGMILNIKVETTDLKLHFGDGEPFLIDGDAVLHQIFMENNWLSDDNSIAWVSSLQTIYQFEKALSTFIERGGNPKVVFFQDFEAFWAHQPELLLIRKIVVRHMTENVKSIETLTQFKNMLDAGFQNFIVEETIMMIVLTLPNNQSKGNLKSYLFSASVLIALSHDLNVSLIEKTLVTFSTINGFSISLFKPQSKEIFNFYSRNLENLQSQNESSIVNSDAREKRPNAEIVRLISEEVSQEMFCSLNYEFLRAMLSIFQVSCAFQKLKIPVSTVLPEKRFDSNEICSRFLSVLWTKLSQYIDCYDKEELITLVEPLWFIKIIFLAQSKESRDLLREMLTREEVVETLNIMNSNPHDFIELIRKEVNIKIDCWIEEQYDMPEVFGTDCLLFSTYLQGTIQDIRVNLKWQPENKKNSFVTDKMHWHVNRPISDDHQRLSSTRYNSSYFVYMTRYGSSIEGEIESNKAIVVSKEKKKNITKKTSNKSYENKSKTAKKLPKAEMIKLENMLNKVEEKLKKLKEESKSRPIERLLNEIKPLECELQNAFAKDKDNDRLAKLSKKLRSFKIKILFTEEERLYRKTSDISGRVRYFEHLKLLDSAEFVHADKTDLRALQRHLKNLKYFDLLKNYFKHDGEGEDLKDSLKRGESFIHFQMEHMSSSLKLETPTDPDPRVDSFIPDLWQRELFDVIDERKSALIIAPTSSGKTYASYYCMEKVLRESDDGIVVYVSPTKALVNQVAATVYARFGRAKNIGKTVYGVFTRDYRFNTMDCQILVTVPACFEILLLSSTQLKWSKRIKYVIFDEIHNIGAEGDASVWERLVALIRCPFIALSATVRNPKDLLKWMQELERFKLEQDKKGHGGSAHLRKYEVKLVEFNNRHADLKKHVVDNDGKIIPVHPLSFLKVKDVSQKGELPNHITLSAKECLQVYQALTKVLPISCADHLDPGNYFDTKFLTRNDIREYQMSLFESLKGFSPDEWKMFLSQLPGYEAVQRQRFILDGESLTQLAIKLKETGMLPAIFFFFDRQLCSISSQLLRRYVEDRCDEEVSVNFIEMNHSERLQKMESSKLVNKKQLDDSDEREDLEDVYLNHAMKFFTQMCSADKFSFAFSGSIAAKDAEFILQQLDLIPYKVDEFLACMKTGVSWHHAGNHAKMKMATEMLFRAGFLQIVFSTTTLAQGIHMPCKTVVFAEESLFLTTLTYHQCSGRAGRRGFDNEGNVIFLDIPPAKMSRLVTSGLPKILGNDPISLSLILRLFIFVTNVEDSSRNEATDKALVVLKNSLALQMLPRLGSQLKLFFLFGVDYLAQEGFLDDSGKCIGLAGLASHLYYTEPFNFYFCYLVRNGELHKLCERKSDGYFTENTILQLLHVVSFLFGRIILNETLYEIRKANRDYNQSKVLLEPIPEPLYQSLKEFHESLQSKATEFIKTCGKSVTQEDELPLSKIKFQSDTKSPSMTSIFCSSPLQGPDLYSVNGLLSKVNRNLFSSSLPLVDFDQPLNRYVLDFFAHGSIKALEHDNGIQAGSAYELLKDINLTLLSIKTSFQEIGPQNDEPEDDLIQAFSQLSNEFRHKFEEAFGLRNKKRLPKGCFRSHDYACSVCPLLKEGQKTISSFGRQFFIWGYGLTCDTRNMVFRMRCYACKLDFVGASINPLTVVLEQLRTHSEHQKCLKQNEVVFQILCGNKDIKSLTTARLAWQNKLGARPLPNYTL